MNDTVTHEADIWIWTGGTSGSWHFLTIDGEAGEEIAAHEAFRRLETGKGRGFGSVKVEARIGETRWTTSVFPSSASGGFILPIKASVRSAEGLAEGDRTSVELTLL